jgi:hypothetical protein
MNHSPEARFVSEFAAAITWLKAFQSFPFDATLKSKLVSWADNLSQDKVPTDSEDAVEHLIKITKEMETYYCATMVVLTSDLKGVEGENLDPLNPPRPKSTKTTATDGETRHRRPKISDEDMVNLKIDLETSADVEEFVKGLPNED